jgi:hypothetical protein
MVASYVSKCVFTMCYAPRGKFWCFMVVFLVVGTTLPSCTSCSNNVVENHTIEDITYTLSPPSPSQIAQILSEAFGKVAWEYYLGEVDEEPGLPDNIEEILDSPCPFWAGKKVKETHLLVLMPTMVDGKPFTLDLLQCLVKRPKKGLSTDCELDDDDSTLQKNLREETPRTRAYWILMTRDVVPATRGKSHNVRQDVLRDIQRNHADYKLPSVLEAATVVLTHYVRSKGEWIYEEASTYCGQRVVDNKPDKKGKCRKKTIFVGKFSRNNHLQISCKIPTAIKFSDGTTNIPLGSMGQGLLYRFH